MGDASEEFFVVRRVERRCSYVLVIKKLNNNTVICIDGRGRQLVAVGTGIGFHSVPYDLEDMSKVQSTFYNISPQYLDMLESIPADVIEFTGGIVDMARRTLFYPLSPNLLLTMADHISFALERQKKGIYIPMPLADDLELTYPTEMKLARRTLRRIKMAFRVRLPENEASGICMGFVNARVYEDNNADCRHAANEQEMVDAITGIIEAESGISIRRETFNYARYATHVRYLLRRLQSGEGIETANRDLIDSTREEYKDTAACVDKIANYIHEQWHFTVGDEEKLYLMLHVNRVCSNEGL